MIKKNVKKDRKKTERFSKRNSEETKKIKEESQELKQTEDEVNRKIKERIEIYVEQIKRKKINEEMGVKRQKKEKQQLKNK